MVCLLLFVNDAATTKTQTYLHDLSRHYALPILASPIMSALPNRAGSTRSATSDGTAGLWTKRGAMPAATCLPSTSGSTAVRSPGFSARASKIERAHICTPVTNAHLVCRLLLEKNNTAKTYRTGKHDQHNI